MHNRLIIIGAGGHGKVIADIALKNNYTDILFLDDAAQGHRMGFPIAGTTASLEERNDGKTDFIIGIGNNKLRKEIALSHNLPWVTLIHPAAQISYGVQLGAGTVVMAGAVINADSKIGKHCIINSCAVVEHDNFLADYVHISPNAALGGTVHLGECTHIGIGASVKNNIDICDFCTIGAGAVVITSLETPATYIGIPAKIANNSTKLR